MVFLVGLTPWVVKGKELPVHITAMTKLLHNHIDTVPTSVKKETDKTDKAEPTVKSTEKIKSVPKSRKQIKPTAVTPVKSVRPVKIKVVNFNSRLYFPLRINEECWKLSLAQLDNM